MASSFTVGIAPPLLNSSSKSHVKPEAGHKQSRQRGGDAAARVSSQRASGEAVIK
jgi:hypothetical protein